VTASDDPSHLSRQHLALGESLASQGRLREAEQAFYMAHTLEPDSAPACVGLAKCQLERGQTAEALGWLERATELDPANAFAHFLMGNARLILGQTLEARASYAAALVLQPDFSEALANLGVACTTAGEATQGIDYLQQALRLAPEVASTHNNLGKAWEDLGQLDKAAEYYAAATRLDPGYAIAHSNLANILRMRGRLDEALVSCQRAFALAAPSAAMLNCHGSILHALGRLDEARQTLERAIALEPRFTDALNNLSNVLQAFGQLDAAVAATDRALAIVPGHPDVHCNRAMTLLLGGNYAEGWREYEWRLRRFAPRQPWLSPTWDGSPLAGRTILLHNEQGLGDTLQFARYVALVREQGGRVILRCQRPLVRLLSRMPGLERIVAEDEPLPPYDVQTSLVSLPGIFGTLLDTIPAADLHIASDPKGVASWHVRLTRRGLRVGIAWQGNPKNVRDRFRSIPLAEFGVLAAVPGVRLFSLQCGFGREQLTGWQGATPIEDLADELTDITETAAAVENLDLVITCDSLLAHLAGALGRPAWVALPMAPDWRWLLGRDDTPWYPTLRLYRQTELGNWRPVFARLAAELAALVRAASLG
jgi:tetratricopeptide (TPR) repeat protein